MTRRHRIASMREVLATLPFLHRFASRLIDPTWPTPEESARAAALLSRDTDDAQPELPLDGTE